jgi:hypothetical protein
MTRTVSKAIFSICLLIACGPGRAVAAETVHLYSVPVPEEAVRLQARISSRLQPGARTWAGEQARRLAAGSMTVESLHQTARSRFGKVGQGDPGDIEAIAFIVLMQATRDMDEDLKNIMAEVKRLQEARNKLRDIAGKVSKDAAGNAGRKGSDPCTPPMCGAYARELAASKPLQDGLRSDLNALDDQERKDSLRLQPMMDRRRKFISMLDGMMSKISTTQDNIVQNLK